VILNCFFLSDGAAVAPLSVEADELDGAVKLVLLEDIDVRAARGLPKISVFFLRGGLELFIVVFSAYFRILFEFSYFSSICCYSSSSRSSRSSSFSPSLPIELNPSINLAIFYRNKSVCPKSPESRFLLF